MIKRIAWVVLALFVVAIPFLKPERASAATTAYAPTCANTDLDMWNWPADLRGEKNPDGQTVTEISGFNSSTSSYLILQRWNQAAMFTTGSHDPHYYNQFTIYSGKNLRVSIDQTGGSGDGQAMLISADNLVVSANLISEPDQDSKYKYNWGGAYGHGVSAGIGNSTVAPNYPHIKMDSSNVKCVYAAKNVTYDSSFTDFYDKFSDHIEYGEYNTSCKLTDLGCIMSKATNAIESAFQATGMAIVQAFGYLFAPDKDQLNTLWTDFYNWMQVKLGFLLYPFTFFNNVFNAFTSSSSWCSASSCTKNFGNLFGHNFTVNLKQTQDTMPTLWTWFTGMIRGLTIVALLIAVRQKYRSVTSK